MRGDTAKAKEAYQDFLTLWRRRSRHSCRPRASAAFWFARVLSPQRF
jgi:hypothetical protein